MTRTFKVARWPTLLLMAVVVGVAGATIWWFRSMPEARVLDSISAEYGPANATMRITALVDPDSTHCRDELNTLAKVFARNPATVRVEVRFVPRHPADLALARALQAAYMQGQSMEVLETFREQARSAVKRNESPPVSELSSVAARTIPNLDTQRFLADVTSDVLDSRFQANGQIAGRLRNDVYPIILIDGKLVRDCELSALHSLS